MSFFIPTESVGMKNLLFVTKNYRKTDEISVQLSYYLKKYRLCFSLPLKGNPSE